MLLHSVFVALQWSLFTAVIVNTNAVVSSAVVVTADTYVADATVCVCVDRSVVTASVSVLPAVLFAF